MNKKLSIVLATYNEEKFLSDCLKSIAGIANEIIIVDGGSTDNTVKIAKSLNAKIKITDNPEIFHVNKQKAIDLATGDWILQLDADERVSNELSHEIKKIISYNNEQIVEYEKNLPNKKLFLRHQELIEERDGIIGEINGEYNAFYLPRLNYFLGKFLRYGGVYPDGVIRLFRKGKAYLPCKGVHEQMIIEGKVGWLQHDLLHMADLTFKRYLIRNSRYIDLLVKEYKENKIKKNIFQFINYFFLKPIWWFLLTQVRHKGILDGFQGIIFSFFSALRFPRAYWRYLRS